MSSSKPSEITVEMIAMMVECPTCGACDLGLHDPDACWDERGDEHVPTHPERMVAAHELVDKMRDAAAEGADV